MNNITLNSCNSDFYFDGKLGSLSRRKLAELCGVNLFSIQNWLKKSDQQTLHEDLQILTQYTFHSDQGIPDIVCEAFIAYYAFKGNKTAQKTYRTFAAIGIRSWIKQEAGYQEQLSPKDYSLQLWKERVELNKQVPDGYFTIFMEIHQLVSDLANAGMILDSKSVPDISVGNCWAYVWNAKNLAEIYGHTLKHPFVYPAHFPQAKANDSIRICVYPDAALPCFRYWYKTEYLIHNLPNYIKTKVKQHMIVPEQAKYLLGAITKQLPGNQTALSFPD